MRARSIACARLLSLALVFGAGCARSSVPGQQLATEARGIVAPATYTGELPCADCPGIQLTATLLPDSTFRLRRVYQGRPTVVHDLGRWSVEENGTQLVLRDGAQ
ncbi:MAG TPA: copper resistance protein NlpE, partial [Gemmatimonadaceae bacterium]|nr:copper resistance protein NlpE [Gemmatimonadaceae bacterium]